MSEQGRIVEGVVVSKALFCALGPKVIRRVHREQGRWMPLRDAPMRIVATGDIPSPWKIAR